MIVHGRDLRALPQTKKVPHQHKQVGSISAKIIVRRLEYLRTPCVRTGDCRTKSLGIQRRERRKSDGGEKSNLILHPGNRTNANKEKPSAIAHFKFGSPMFEIDATVTTSTRTELKLTANWPLIWLRKPGYIQIERNLLPNEIVPSLNSFVERSELSVDRELLWNLQPGDRVLIQCFLKGESLELAMDRPDPNPGKVIDCQEDFQRSVMPTS
jgi:hypothetical protein